jgi:hypothetical protein
MAKTWRMMIIDCFSSLVDTSDCWGEQNVMHNLAIWYPGHGSKEIGTERADSTEIESTFFSDPMGHFGRARALQNQFFRRGGLDHHHPIGRFERIFVRCDAERLTWSCEFARKSFSVSIRWRHLRKWSGERKYEQTLENMGRNCNGSDVS